MAFWLLFQFMKIHSVSHVSFCVSTWWKKSIRKSFTLLNHHHHHNHRYHRYPTAVDVDDKREWSVYNTKSFQLCAWRKLNGHHLLNKYVTLRCFLSLWMCVYFCPFQNIGRIFFHCNKIVLSIVNIITISALLIWKRAAMMMALLLCAQFCCSVCY